MKADIRFKLKSRHLLFVLAAMALVLIAMGIAGIAGVNIPQKTASDVSNVVILGALGVFLYNRKLRADEAKARAEGAEQTSAQLAASQLASAEIADQPLAESTSDETTSIEDCEEDGGVSRR